MRANSRRKVPGAKDRRDILRRGVDTPKGIETGVGGGYERIAGGEKRERGGREESAESGDATRLQVRRESNFPRQILKCAPEPGWKARAEASHGMSSRLASATTTFNSARQFCVSITPLAKRVIKLIHAGNAVDRKQSVAIRDAVAI